MTPGQRGLFNTCNEIVQISYLIAQGEKNGQLINLHVKKGYEPAK